MPGEGRVSKKNRIDLFLISSITIFVSVCDQIAKLIVRKAVFPNTSLPVIKNIFHITPVFNRGAAFGIFKGGSAFFIIIAVIASFFIISYLLRAKRGGFSIKLSSALILGGILGNLIDRLRFGYVVDFLDFRIWPVFNIADSAIAIGAGLITLHLLRRRKA